MVGAKPHCVDIFCRVIDNYGDIGVCWRLARQLAQAPFLARVRLWVDDLSACQALVPDIDPRQVLQSHHGVEVRHWNANPEPVLPAQVVIEAFACSPPADYVRAITAETIWINLEYLSAESWVQGCHGLPSPQANGVTKWFFFPGFSQNTGGLLRENTLLAQRDAWQAKPTNRWDLLSALDVPNHAKDAIVHGARQVLLFCYPHAPVSTLLQGLVADTTPSVVLASPNTVQAQHKHCVQNTQVQLYEIPFVAQTMFDPLLWSSDLNCVRGEDSIIRALWAARPLLWQLYPQAQDTHLQKLEAWLARAPYPKPVMDLIRGWNTPAQRDRHPLIQPLRQMLEPSAWRSWCRSAQDWCQTLAQQDDLATALMAFCAHKKRNW